MNRRIEAQQFELPVLPTLQDKEALAAVLRRLPLERATALRDQCEAELARKYPEFRNDFACIATAGPGALKRFYWLLSPLCELSDRPSIAGAYRPRLRLFYTLARLCVALASRPGAIPAEQPSDLHHQPQI